MLATLNAIFVTGWPTSIPPAGALAVVQSTRTVHAAPFELQDTE